ncbi:MAG: haloacid dehalogenase-like hydrolase [Clostridia bacterium]|nr:haloacid dehalogenase-like hydrolase [Clostridia bacterium]MBQ6426872.1 haloacid dehalogenase-like hydrolase [Clostridia bacterium]MBR0444892.1 haloacid dehalogenase-like hydrolase [Clostridia bacterium]
MKHDPLPSWRDTETKETILSFVKCVTDPASADFIPEEDRVAVSDFDGTLVGENGGIGVPGWIEIELMRHVLSERFPSSPHAQELLRTYDRLAEKLASDPEPSKTETGAYWDAYFRVAGLAVKGLTVEEACGLIGMQMGKDYAPGMPFTGMAYVPMQELYAFLTENGFRFHVVSGSGRNTIYAVCHALFTFRNEGIPYTRCIGMDFEIRPGGTGNRFRMEQTDRVVNLNIDDEKCENVMRETGKTPVLAIGNDLPDEAMLNWALSNERYRALSMYILHDDGERERFYGTEQGIRLIGRNGWLPVSMRKDFGRIFG